MKKRTSAWLARAGERILAVPIIVKVLGIGALVGLLFGGLIYLQASRAMTTRLCELLEQRTRSGAETLAVQLEQALILDDVVRAEEGVRQAMERFPDLRYVIIRDASGTVRMHTFRNGVPEALRPPFPGDFRVLDSGQGLVQEASVPILSGEAGRLQFGMGDQSVREGLVGLRRALASALILSALIGSALGFLLARALTRPLKALLQATDRLGQGAHPASLPVVFGDEIGELTEAFNQMAARLGQYRREVEEKERVRRSLLDKLVRSQEDERAAISRELHDELGQSLSALLVRVQSFGKGPPPVEGVRELEARLRAVIDEVRRLAWGMRPSVLDDSGLDLAIRRLLEDVGSRARMKIDYQFLCGEEGRRLPQPVEVAFYRVAQEALTNVVRHSGADVVSVVLLAEADRASIVVEDNGRGLDGRPPAGGHGLGILGMRERVEMLDGTFTLESAPGRGTTVAARVHWE